MSHKSRAITQAHDGQVIVGIKNNLQNESSLPLSGTTFTMPALTQLVQSRIDAINEVATTKAAWRDAVARCEALDTRVTKIVRSLRNYVMDVHGEESPILADFGFTPPRKGTLTPEQAVARSQLAAATRKARGTMGKKAKLKIKGTVP